MKKTEKKFNNKESLSLSFLMSIILHIIFFLLFILYSKYYVPKMNKKIPAKEIIFTYQLKLPEEINSETTHLSQKNMSDKKPNATITQKSKEAKGSKEGTKKSPPVKLPEVNDNKKVPGATLPDEGKTIKTGKESNLEKKQLSNQEINEPDNRETMEGGSTGNTGLNINPSGDMVLYGPIVNRNIIYSEIPEYPEWARKKGIETEIKLKFWVSPEGDVFNIGLIRKSGYLSLDLLAANSLKKWKFTPLVKNAVQENQWGEILVKFILY